MRHPLSSRPALLLALGALGCSLVVLRAEEEGPPAAPASREATAASAVKPKPLSEQVKKGLAYLVSQQHANGGWGQGGGWRTGEQGGRVEGPQVQDPPDVANTCMAALALLRAGNTPTSGPYARNVANAIEFICSHIDRADGDSLHITSVRGTQVQSKIGPYIDTFLAALVLAEVKGQSGDPRAEKRLTGALEKTVAKIAKHQKEDGTFAGNTGWASVFSQGFACKGLNRAYQRGVAVSGQALARAEKNAVDNLDVAKGTFRSPAAGAGGLATTSGRAGGGLGVAGGGAAPVGAPTDAGVSIYNASNQLAALQESVNSNRLLLRQVKEVLADKNAPVEAKQKAQDDLTRIEKSEQAQRVAVGGVIKQLEDSRFIRGFGSNGGEEFLSYLNIGETLVVQGGPEWEKWDRSITENMQRIQNQDGSWSGDHCITGRTFCTAAALLVLMADRTPVPVAARIERGK